MPLSTIANWSPTVDFAATDESSALQQGSGAKYPDPSFQDEEQCSQSSNHDRIFAASGRGVKGTITEYRNGIQANIGLDLDYDAAVRQSWIFPVSLNDSSHGYHLLLSMPDRSVVLHLADDFSQADEQGADAVVYDLSSRTLAASQVSDQLIVQVTEHHVVLLGASQR